MRTSHFIAILSLSTALATSLGSPPASAAFEFMSKAKPVATVQPAAVPVTKTDSDVTIGDLAKEPSVPVWTAKKAAQTTTDIPLTPVVSSSDSLQMLDGPLLPDEMDAPTSLTPAKAPFMLPPVTSKRQVLASSNSAMSKTVTSKPTPMPLSSANMETQKRNAALWDKPSAPINATLDPVLAGMTTDKPMMAASPKMPSALAPTVPNAKPLPSPTEPMSLASGSDLKPMDMAADEPAAMTANSDKEIEIADDLPPTSMAMTHAVPMTPAPIVETTMDPMPAMAPTDDAVVEGFGTNLPLAMALRQIVPPTYRFSFADGVNPGQRVSWQGGKNWSQVVADIAAKNGLSSEIAGNVIAIRGAGTNGAMTDVLMGAVQTGAVQAPMPMAPVTPIVPPPMTLSSPAAMPPKLLASKASVSAVAAQTEQMPVMNKSIAVDDVMAPVETVKPVAPVAVIGQKGLVLPPPAQPLQDTLQDTKELQAVVTADKPETKANIATTLTTPGEWTAHSGQSLRTILQDWSHQANVSLVWASDFDYPLQTDIRIQGTYPDAVRTLLAGFSNAKPKPLGRLHNNTGVGAQPVLIVDTPRLLKE